MWMELKKGEENPMLRAAQAISITGGAEDMTPEEQELEDMRGAKVADRVEDDPRFQPKKEDRTGLVTMNDGEQMPRWLLEGDDAEPSNGNGSFESLMAGWAPSSHGAAFDTASAKESGD